jgi:hypothetical protein
MPDSMQSMRVRASGLSFLENMVLLAFRIPAQGGDDDGDLIEKLFEMTIKKYGAAIL